MWKYPPDICKTILIQNRKWLERRDPDNFCLFLDAGMVCLFDLILYVPVNISSVMSGRVLLGYTSTKQGLVSLAQGHNAMTPVMLEPAALRSRFKHSTTEQLRSLRGNGAHGNYRKCPFFRFNQCKRNFITLNCRNMYKWYVNLRFI